jgi:hypothetical protein
MGHEEREHHIIEKFRLLFHQHVPCFRDDMKFSRRDFVFPSVYICPLNPGIVFTPEN